MVQGAKYLTGLEDFTLESLVDEYVQSAHDSQLTLNQLSIFSGLSLFDWIISEYSDIKIFNNFVELYIHRIRVIVIRVDTFYADELRVFPVYRDLEGNRIHYRKFNRIL